MIKLFCNGCDGIYDSCDIRFTKSCDNKCPFCIERKGLEFLGKTNVDEILKTVIDTGVKDILILGGEPMLLPEKVLSFVKSIRNLEDGKDYKIYITTSLPKTFMDKKEICYKVLSLIDGLNVSIQHYNSENNNAVLNASSKHNRLKLLTELNKHFASVIRTSINLYKGGIDSLEELRLCLITLANCGCKNIKINELQHSTDVYVSFEEITGIKMESPYSHGCQTTIQDAYLNTHRFDNVIVKRSCYRVEKSRRATFSDLLKTISKLFYQKKNSFNVIYENGLKSNCWIKK